MLVVLIVFPLIIAAISLVLPWYQVRSWLLPFASGLHLLLSVLLCLGQFPIDSSWIGLMRCRVWCWW